MDETYNLFAQQKRQFYPGADAQGTVAGQVAGETPEQFALGKQSANSLSGNSGSTIQTETAAPQLKAQPKPSLGGYTQQRSISNMDELINAMYTSPQEEDRLRKASVANQRIMAIGDALRHIGNIASTVNYAPSQTFNSPVMEEQARYERGKAMRDAANARYFSYQQQKAAQEAKARQWEAEQKYKREKDNRDFMFNATKWNTEFGEKQRQADLKNKLETDKLNADVEHKTKTREETHRHNKALEGHSAARVGISRQNANRMQAYTRWKMNGGGSGAGGRGTLTFRGANGFYSRQMSAQDANAFYNQAFDALTKTKGANGKPIIDADAVAGNIIHSPLFGGNKINMQARKEAVDKAIFQHPEAGKMLQEMFEFSYEPRASMQTATPTQQYSSGLKLGRDYWSSVSPQGGGYGSTFTPTSNNDDDWDQFLVGEEEEEDDWNDFLE